jgi:hypothetical protein
MLGCYEVSGISALISMKFISVSYPVVLWATIN